jgi:Tfp pilus assembly protein PilW
MSMISRPASDERGFTIVELLVSTVVAVLILGGAVTITSQVQGGYRRQMEEVAAEQEGRYALDWVSRLIRAAGNNPYSIETSNCPAAGTEVKGLIIAAATAATTIRIQTDSNPPDKLLGGNSVTGACDQPNEDVTVSYDAGTRSITFLDNNLGGGASVRTEPVITALQFIYRDGSHVEIDPADFADPDTADQVMYIETRITVQPRAIGNLSGNVARVMSQEVRIKGRVY